MAATGADDRGYELAQRISEDHDARPLTPTRIEEEPTPRTGRLSDDDGEDDEIEQLLSTGPGRLSRDDFPERGKELDESSDPQPGPAAGEPKAAGSSKNKRTLLARLTGGMTAKQRQRFAAEMLKEVSEPFLQPPGALSGTLC